MSARLLDGEALARRLLDRLRPRIAALRRRRGRPPGLAIVSIGQDRVSRLYARRKLEACRGLGIYARLRSPAGRPSEPAILRWLERLAKDRRFDAILIESPLPKPLDFARLAGRVPEGKDAEGLSFANSGRLFSAKSWKEIAALKIPTPATAQAAMALVRKSRLPLSGARAVVVGRSSIAGRPAAHMLSACDATVTLCHSRTRRLRDHLREADIVICAAGSPGLIRGPDLKRGAVVVDAGASLLRGRLRGDADFGSAGRVAGWITPVPGGVGPLTTACLLSNVVLCAERSRPRASRSGLRAGRLAALARYRPALHKGNPGSPFPTAPSGAGVPPRRSVGERRRRSPFALRAKAR